MERITQPLVMVWGGLDVFNTPRGAADSIVSIRECRLIRVLNAGHAAWLHNLKAVGSVVTEHITP